MKHITFHTYKTYISCHDWPNQATPEGSNSRVDHQNKRIAFISLPAQTVHWIPALKWWVTLCWSQQRDLWSKTPVCYSRAAGVGMFSPSALHQKTGAGRRQQAETEAKLRQAGEHLLWKVIKVIGWGEDKKCKVYVIFNLDDEILWKSTCLLLSGMAFSNTVQMTASAQSGVVSEPS